MPYLITEHNGHMFPTKRFDQEERLTEQALRHLRVINRALGDSRTAGAIGWCAWDYNTHREFGSGDRICYHGVADMFRIPKYAAAAYASQMNPEKKLVLEAASLFAKGEREAARLLPVWVFTNCDEVILYKNGREIGTFAPARKEFPHLPHPPVLLDDLLGKQADELPYSQRDRQFLRRMMSFILIKGEEKLTLFHYLRLGLFMKRNKLTTGDLASLFFKYNAGWGEKEDRFDLAGLWKGEEVLRRTYGSGRASRLSIRADDQRLSAGDWDTTRVEFRLEDQYGNILPFVPEIIRFEVEGPGEVIGPESTTLIGGVIACWIRTHGTPGSLRVRGLCSRFASETLEIAVVDAETSMV